jgi:predicted ATPase
MTTPPIPPTVDNARRVLTAILAADPVADDAAAVTEALDVLIDVHPPYPPLGLEDDPTEPETGIPVVLALLDQAIATAGLIPELCRYGEAVALLRRAPSATPPEGRP